ncbi:TPA: hypothetical protein ACGUWK_004263 [Vibrio vulnificus]|nr:hypothetical protein [Vibrio vulnificus]
MLSSSRLVVSKNILVSLSTILIIALASNNLSSQELVIISTFILFFNLQNTLFEGLFGLHLLSASTQAASIAIVKQFKYMMIASSTSGILFFTYTSSFEFYSFDDLMFISILSSFVFILGIISNSVTNVYCNQNEKSIFFALDIIMLIFSLVFIYCKSALLVNYLLPFGLRSLGTSFLYFHSFKKTKKRSIYFEEEKLVSGRFFTSTALSVSRDSLMPLLCGVLLGPNILVFMRIFNTIVSAPGLLANSMNKVIVRYISQDKINSKLIFNKYKLWLSVMSISYLSLWFFGGHELINMFFSDKFDVNINYLLLSLCLFCFFWPFGQVLIVKSLNNGDSFLYLKMSLIWTVATLVNLLILCVTSFEVYMISFGTMQFINLFIYVKYYAYDKKNQE